MPTLQTHRKSPTRVGRGGYGSSWRAISETDAVPWEFNLSCLSMCDPRGSKTDQSRVSLSNGSQGAPHYSPIERNDYFSREMIRFRSLTAAFQRWPHAIKNEK